MYNTGAIHIKVSNPSLWSKLLKEEICKYIRIDPQSPSASFVGDISYWSNEVAYNLVKNISDILGDDVIIFSSGEYDVDLNATITYYLGDKVQQGCYSCIDYGYYEGFDGDIERTYKMWTFNYHVDIKDFEECLKYCSIYGEENFSEKEKVTLEKFGIYGYESSEGPIYVGKEFKGGLLSKRKNLKSIVIPAGTTKIPEKAFYNCKKLEKIVIPETVTDIGKDAFTGTKWLQKQGDFVVVNGILLACQNIEAAKISIPSGVAKISKTAFKGLKNATEIVVPETVTEIEDRAFYDCINLQKIENQSKASVLKAINKNAPIADSLVEKPKKVAPIIDKQNLPPEKIIKAEWISEKLKDGTLKITRYKGTDEKIVIPGEIGGIPVTVVGQHALTAKIKKTVKEVIVPDSVVKIEDWAFSQTPMLENVKLSSKLKLIGNCLFWESKSLKRIEIPEGVTKIYSYAFYKCKNLETVVLPKRLKLLCGRAFEGCEKLKEITIPDFVEKIENSAFEGCKNLENAYIPDSVVGIENSAFAGCIKLTNISIPKNMKKVENGVFYGCINLKSAVIPRGIEEIACAAFSYCSGLKNIIIPDTVKKIGERAFSECSNLKSITIPESVTEIGDIALPSWQDLTVHAPSGSYAEQYAKENWLKFEASVD